MPNHIFRTALFTTTLLSIAIVSGCEGGGSTLETNAEFQQAAQQAQSGNIKRSYLSQTPVQGGLTPERLHAAPPLNGTSVNRAKIAPNGEFVTLLQGRKDDAAQQDLWAYDLKTGEGRLLVDSTDLLGKPEELSAEEKNRRERARQYGRGIVDYSWVGQDLLLFPLGGDIYLYDLSTNKPRQVTATKGFETDPKVSRDGSLIAYVRGNELYVKDLKTGLERQITDGATETIRNATASFVVQEELDRSTGYWLSPDASKAAYTQIDESQIAIENRIEFGANGIENVSQRYPFAGTKNATVKLGVVSTKGGATRWVDIGNNKDIYLTRVAWAADNRTLYAGILARDHKTHTIYRIDSRTGKSEAFYEETSPTWLNIRSGFRATKDGELIFTAERNNKRQLFKVTKDKEIIALTPETLLTRRLLCLTSDAAYVSGWQDNALSTHVFKVALTSSLSKGDVETSEPIATQITKSAGQHSASFNADCSRYLGRFENDNTPPNLRAYEANGTPLAWINENALSADHPYAPFRGAHITPEYGTITAEDGTPLDYTLYKPTDLQAGEKRASITIVYGGPGVQRVINRWNRKHFARMLAHHGFVVFLVDGRGATNRGKAFEDVLYRSMGRAEVVDQSTGARWLQQQSFIDPERMGIYGWSYGGYMTLHMLAQTNLYKSGVSGAPVTDWALYDTAYTERYLGSPIKGDANYTAGAYENSSVFAYLDGLTEPVLLIHGMADDNVVFRHSVKLMGEMQKIGRHNLRVMTYPGEKHGFRSQSNRTHRDRQILNFFLETLDIQEGN